MEPEQVAGIVKLLTKAQRDGLVTKRIDRAEVPAMVGAGLITYRRIYHSLGGRSIPIGYESDFTPLGYAVRSALAKEPGHEK